MTEKKRKPKESLVVFYSSIKKADAVGMHKEPSNKKRRLIKKLLPVSEGLIDFETVMVIFSKITDIQIMYNAYSCCKESMLRRPFGRSLFYKKTNFAMSRDLIRPECKPLLMFSFCYPTYEHAFRHIHKDDNREFKINGAIDSIPTSSYINEKVYRKIAACLYLYICKKYMPVDTRSNTTMPLSAIQKGFFSWVLEKKVRKMPEELIEILHPKNSKYCMDEYGSPSLMHHFKEMNAYNTATFMSVLSDLGIKRARKFSSDGDNTVRYYCDYKDREKMERKMGKLVFYSV